MERREEREGREGGEEGKRRGRGSSHVIPVVVVMEAYNLPMYGESVLLQARSFWYGIW